MSSHSIPKILDFLRLCSRLERTPGFSTAALGLSYDRIAQLAQTNDLMFDANKKRLELRFPLQALPLLLPSSPVMMGQRSATTDVGPVSLATYMAMMDDITTWALVLADSKRSRAGKSVCLRAAWNPNRRQPMTGPEEVEFVCQVKKIGRNLAFVGAEVRDSGTKELICYGSHIKYMPMGVVIDFALSSTGWGLTKLYSTHVLSDPKPFSDNVTTDLFEPLQLCNDDCDNDDATMATFTPSKVHASLGGPIHGGCQAVLMEIAANEYAGRQQDPNKLDGKTRLRLDSISVDYMSPPKSKFVHLKVDQAVGRAACRDCDALSLRVQLVGADDGRAKSEGSFNYSLQT